MEIIFLRRCVSWFSGRDEQETEMGIKLVAINLYVLCLLRMENEIKTIYPCRLIKVKVQESY